MLASMNRAKLTVTPEQLARWKYPKEIFSAVLDKDTGKFMKYQRLINNPKYCPLYRNTYDKEIGQLA